MVSGEWGIGHERAPPSRTYPGRIRGARASSHDAACARPPSDPRTRALVTSDSTQSREPFRNVALLNQNRKKATSPRHSIAAHARSDPDAMATQIAKKIVVVGGGNSAGYFARAVVAAGRGADLLICSAEEVLPYERPALTKAFLNETGPARLPGFHTSVGGGGERQNQEWYDANGVEVHLGTRVVAWDPSAKTVTTDKSTSIGYEKLIVAIGCTALKLPASMGGDLPGVHYVRDNADALSLYDAMAGAKAPVVIGGGEFFFIFVWEIRLTTRVLFTGYIGLEVAASCAARNMNPAVVMMEPHVMARLWSPEIAAHYENLYESKGTTFHKNAKVKAINKGSDGAVESVELEGGVSIPADLVIVGVGAGAVTAPFDALESHPGTVPGRHQGGRDLRGVGRGSRAQVRVRHR